VRERGERKVKETRRERENYIEQTEARFAES
jgi:hypothetical protein